MVAFYDIGLTSAVRLGLHYKSAQPAQVPKGNPDADELREDSSEQDPGHPNPRFRWACAVGRRAHKSVYHFKRTCFPLPLRNSYIALPCAITF